MKGDNSMDYLHQQVRNLVHW